MANLHDIERRIKSVTSTKQITSTMQMVASAKVGRSANRLEKSRPYSDAISRLLKKLNDDSSDCNHPLMEVHDTKKTVLYIVIVSDKGLAGGFNSNILRLVDRKIKQNKKEGINSLIITCGKKANSYFEFRNITSEMKFAGTSDNPQFDQAEKIGTYCIDKYIANEIDEVVLVYNKCKNNIEQTVAAETILPISEKLAENNEVSEGENKNAYNSEILFEPDAMSVMSDLIPVYIRNIIFSALLDSAAGEQIARRVAMQAATDNAEEMIETLTRLYNSVRQGAITTEINELVGGAEALNN